MPEIWKVVWHMASICSTIVSFSGDIPGTVFTCHAKWLPEWLMHCALLINKEICYTWSLTKQDMAQTWNKIQNWVGFHSPTQKCFSGCEVKKQSQTEWCQPGGTGKMHLSTSTRDMGSVPVSGTFCLEKTFFTYNGGGCNALLVKLFAGMCEKKLLDVSIHIVPKKIWQDSDIH